MVLRPFDRQAGPTSGLCTSRNCIPTSLPYSIATQPAVWFDRKVASDDCNRGSWEPYLPCGPRLGSGCGDLELGCRASGHRHDDGVPRLLWTWCLRGSHRAGGGNGPVALGLVRRCGQTPIPTASRRSLADLGVEQLSGARRRQQAAPPIRHRPRRWRAVARHDRIEHNREMQILCADCGCLVERGSVIKRCRRSDCCCAHLPDVDRPAAAE